MKKHIAFIGFWLAVSGLVFGQTVPLNVQKTAGTNAITADLVFSTGRTLTISGGGILSATSPRFVTDISDTNGNEIFKITATASAVNEFTIANAAAAGSPTLSATGSDTDISISLSPKGTGYVLLGNGAGAIQPRLMASAGAQALIGFFDGGTAKWQLGKQTDNTFIFFDNAGSATAYSVTTGASSGQFYIQKTTASSSVSTGALRVDGGIGVAENINVGGNVVTQTIGKTLGVKSGSNAKAGTFTLASGAATLSNTSITANSVLVCWLKTASGAITAHPYATAVSVGTSYTIAAGVGDNSTYNYIILEVN